MTSLTTKHGSLPTCIHCGSQERGYRSGQAVLPSVASLMSAIEVYRYWCQNPGCLAMVDVFVRGRSCGTSVPGFLVWVLSNQSLTERAAIEAFRLAVFRYYAGRQSALPSEPNGVQVHIFADGAWELFKPDFCDEAPTTPACSVLFMRLIGQDWACRPSRNLAAAFGAEGLAVSSQQVMRRTELDNPAPLPGVWDPTLHFVPRSPATRRSSS